MKKLEIQINITQRSKDWWIVAKEIRNAQPQIGTHIKAQAFKRYFKTLLIPSQNIAPIQYAVNKIANFELDKPVTPNEILSMLQKTRPGKAPGQDRIPYEFFLKNDEIYS